MAATTFRRHAASIAAVALLAAACGDGAEPATSAPATSAPADGADATDTDTGTDAGADDAGADAGADDAGGPTDQPAVGESKPTVGGADDEPTELVITDLVDGDGDPAAAGDTVRMHYVGVLTVDGTEFDSSWDRGAPFDVTLGEGSVIPGFEQGLLGVTEGMRRRLDIPSELAYGSSGAGGAIPPDTAITFVLDILSVVTPVPPIKPECPAADRSTPTAQNFTEAPPMCIDPDATYTAEIVTNHGAITVELYADRAPQTVNNFVVLAGYHYFDGTECHRAIPGFVVQCGDPTATGRGGPGYRFGDELPEAGEYAIGSLAMANSGPDTNGSQFFIITGDDGAALPPQYSLFGRVVEGLDTTVAALDELGNPGNNGVPPLAPIVIESVTIAEP